MSVVYVGSGQAFPDALSGASAAGKNDGPVLLVQNGLLPLSTAQELARLQPGADRAAGQARARSTRRS